MMTHNCESGLNYDQLDNVIAIPSKLPSELYLYRENYSQIDRPQSFSFSHIKLILTAHRKLSQLQTRLYFLEYRYSVKILLKNTSELFTQCTADAFAIHVSDFSLYFCKISQDICDNEYFVQTVAGNKVHVNHIILSHLLCAVNCNSLYLRQCNSSFC